MYLCLRKAKFEGPYLRNHAINKNPHEEVEKNSFLRERVTLTPAQGGLGVPNLRVEAPRQYAASKLLT